jgi:hypothetical protein
MYEAAARSGWNVSTPGTLDHPMLCAEQFIMAYDTLTREGWMQPLVDEA